MLFLAWVRRTSDDLIAKGKPKAYCKYCEVPLRAHLNGLVKHGETDQHKKNSQRFNRSSQPTLHNYGAALYVFREIIILEYFPLS